ncbi:NUDIX domain-containing protein [Halosimplex marinum]|uniref:NUDIX domain-containing protein n=1 Tax=Halosimplex marinum TaxID=3396620 RepID=UPI003F56939B
MGYDTDELELSSDFQPLEGEANFGPPLTKEVVGGVHIAPHAVTVEDSDFILTDWHEGLPRHDSPGERSIRFPHGLMEFGETFEECAERLVDDQLGMAVDSTQVVHVYSRVDSQDHWHLEPLILTQVSGDRDPPEDASVVSSPTGPTLPDGAKWIGKPPFSETYENHLAEFLE